MPVLLSSISLFGKALFYTQFGMASLGCQVPELLHTKIRVNTGESVSDLPRQTDWESDSPDSHEAALDYKS